jgi:hypothetical protein
MSSPYNRKLSRYEVWSSGYDAVPVFGCPGDLGAAYKPHKFLSAHASKSEAEAACAEARRPSDTVYGTNSTWRTVEDAYVRDWGRN